MARLLDVLLSPLKYINRLISSIEGKIPHSPSGAEVAMIINTNLFRKMTDDELVKLLSSIRIKKFPAGEIILKEGEIGEDFYIIADGSARVFIKDLNENIIQLNKLLPGHYFGEQAIYDETVKTRNASIDAITDITLIQIHGKYLTDLVKKDESLKSRVEERKLNQSVNIMLHASIFQKGIEAFLSQVENPHVLEFKDKECIFKIGDVSDRVYMILQGKVKLLIPEKSSDIFSILILNKGHLFGELGVMNDAPRSATAIADSNLRLLAIDGSEFKKDASLHKDFSQLIAKFQEMYQLPMRGTVEQYAHNVPDVGNSIENVYKLDDGRTVHSSKVLNKDIFAMRVADEPDGSRYEYISGDNHIEIFVTNHKLTAIKANGHCEALPYLCHILLDNLELNDADLDAFQSTGTLSHDDK